MANPSTPLVVVALLLFCSIFLVAGQGTSLAGNVEQMAQTLYSAIRAVAFPDSPQLLEDKTNIDTRFVLLSPGKILNYQDYYPGEEYTKFLQNPSSNQRFAVVPPHVMEKWFDLADVMPSANPFNGQDSGRSLSNVYRSILRESTIKNLQNQGEQLKILYEQAIEFLHKVLPHPENLDKKTTRLALYEEYKEMYNKRKLEMEDKIEDKRRTLPYIDYELWFQRNYPSLLSNIESAYHRWLIFGQKELCDNYISVLGAGSSAKILDEARTILRSAGVTSLDRTRTIYPVSFEPSDWYKYLVPQVEEPSRSELQHLLGEIQADIEYVNEEIRFYETSNSELDQVADFLYNQSRSQSKQRRNLTNLYLELELECSASNMNVSAEKEEACERFSEMLKTLMDTLDQEAIAKATAEEFPWNDDYKGSYTELLKARRDALEGEKRQVLDAMDTVSDTFFGFVESDPEVVASVIDSKKEDNWLQFEYSSEEEKSSQTTFTKTWSNSRWKGAWSSRSGSTVESKLGFSFEDFSNAKLNAKGKLLRVHIKRPWFRPEVFDDKNLDFVSNSEDGSRVLGSPGSHLTEYQFINAISGGGGPDTTTYRLPEFVSSFLLVKDLELEISNMKSQKSFFRAFVKSDTVKRGFSNNFYFGTSTSDSSSHSRVYKTANGMKIKVAGAQLIGYYMQKIPKFPLGRT